MFCRGFCPAPTAKRVLGELGVPVRAGGAYVRTGDVLFGDCDGVVVVPLEVEDEVFERALAKHEKERWLAGKIEARRATLELCGFGDLVEELAKL